jgi:hypothetical protein
MEALEGVPVEDKVFVANALVGLAFLRKPWPEAVKKVNRPFPGTRLAHRCR